MCVCVQVFHMHMLVEARIQLTCCSSEAISLVWGAGGGHSQAKQASHQLQGSSCFCLPSTGLINARLLPQPFLIGFLGKSNSHPHTCTLLPTEPSPQPTVRVFHVWNFSYWSTVCLKWAPKSQLPSLAISLQFYLGENKISVPECLHFSHSKKSKNTYP